MTKVSAAAVAATGVGGTGAAALGAYGMGYFGDGSDSYAENFSNPKHREWTAQNLQYTPLSAPLNEQITNTSSNKYKL